VIGPCYIGTDLTFGQAAANEVGISVEGPDNPIGGVVPVPIAAKQQGDSSVFPQISGNTQKGIETNINGIRTVILNCAIGTNLAGTDPLANGGFGIDLNSSGNTVGSSDGYGNGGNLMSGNSEHGIQVDGSDNVIMGNDIGTTLNGMPARPNGWDGVYLSDTAAGNTIGGYVSSTRNFISGNGRSVGGPGFHAVRLRLPSARPRRQPV
jgi:hypothetical protein